MGENLIGGLYKIVHEDPPRLDDAGPMATVLEHTMVRDPAQRWTMVQVRDHLDALRRGETPTQVVPVPAPVPPVSAGRPRRRAGRPTTRTTTIAPTPRSARRRRSPLPWLVALAAAVLVGIIAFAALQDDPEEPTAGTDPSPSETTGTSEPTQEPSQETPTEEATRPATRARDDRVHLHLPLHRHLGPRGDLRRC